MSGNRKNRKKIMIVDDNITNLTVARNLLRSYYEIYPAPSADQMFEMLEKIRPDLILLDIEMPDMDGYEAIAKLKAAGRFSGIPVIFLTARNNEESELKGFDLGAADYINKPFFPPLLLKRIEHQLLIAQQRETIQRHADRLSVLVSEKFGEIISLQSAILDTVADLVECRDQFTGGHIARTQRYLKVMMDGLQEDQRYKSKISGWDMDYILQSAQLHDVGKIAIPDAILNKPGRLTPEEYEIMQTHVTVGIDAVNRIISKTKEQDFLRHTRNIVGAHHEKWDGSGYPYGLRGEEIPLEGRLMAVADVYDALVSWRPYKEKMSHEHAKTIIMEGRGTHFDPAIVDIFLSMASVFEQVSIQDGSDSDEGWRAITFTAEMKIGEPKIDAEHKALIDRLNLLMSTRADSVSREEIQETLDFLGGCVIRHFADEENLQKQSGYPKYEWHKSQHQLFIGEYQKLKREFADNGVSAAFSQKLNKSMINWITRHIKLVDVEFGKYYQLRTPSGGTSPKPAPGSTGKHK